MRKNTVAIIGEHLLIRHGFKLMINSFEKFQVVHEAINGIDFIQNISKLKNIPDFAIIDLSSAVHDTLAAIRVLNIDYPQIRCLIISADEEATVVFDMIQAGAKAYLLKNSSADLVEETLNDVLQLGASFSPIVVEKLLEHERNNDKAKIVAQKSIILMGLTVREIEFIKLCCTSNSYKQIAIIMEISPRTVDSFRQDIFKKLNIHSREELMLFAFDNGLYLAKNTKE